MDHLATSLVLRIVETIFTTWEIICQLMISSAGLGKVGQVPRIGTREAMLWPSEHEFQVNQSMWTILLMKVKYNKARKMITSESCNSRSKRQRLGSREQKMKWPDLTCCRSRKFRKTCRIWIKGRELILPRKGASHLLKFRYRNSHSSSLPFLETTRMAHSCKVILRLVKSQKSEEEIQMLPIKQTWLNWSQKTLATSRCNKRIAPLISYRLSDWIRAIAWRWLMQTIEGHLLCRARSDPARRSFPIAPRATSCS